LERDLEMHSGFQMGTYSAKKLVSDWEIHLRGSMGIPRVMHLERYWKLHLGGLLGIQRGHWMAPGFGKYWEMR